MYRVRYMYLKKCLSTFYNSYAKTIISYGLLIYGSAHKWFWKCWPSSASYSKTLFFQKKMFDSLWDVYQQTKTLTIYEMFIIEFFREIINQLRSKSPLDYRDEMDNRNMYETRRSVKGLLPITYRRTVTKSKSLKNTLRSPHHTTLIEYQTKPYLETICNLYIKDSQDLKNLFFKWILLNRIFFISLPKPIFFITYLFEVKT